MLPADIRLIAPSELLHAKAGLPDMAPAGRPEVRGAPFVPHVVLGGVEPPRPSVGCAAAALRSEGRRGGGAGACDALAAGRAEGVGR